MVLRGPCPCLLLTLVLLSACLALSSGQSWARLKQKFKKQHVDFPRTPVASRGSYCEEMMYNRGLYGKRRNTFIHAPLEKICQVCSWDGINISTGLRESRSQFRITTCVYKRLTNTYKMKRFTQKITIGCWNRLPVFYEE